jgi:hypothetical protein
LFGPAIKETGPFGVPEEELTLIVTLTDWPCVMVVGARVSVVTVGAKLTAVQFFTRLAILTEPRPVARSYPAVVVQAGEEDLLGLTMTPYPL